MIKFFRKDSHDWTKKTDGKTVRETHEKLKVQKQDHAGAICLNPEVPSHVRNLIEAVAAD